MADKTKFIINTSVEYFAAAPISDDAELAAHTAAVLEFLDNDELTVIAAVLNKSDGKIKFHHSIPNDEVCLLFYKIPQINNSGSHIGGINGNARGHGNAINKSQAKDVAIMEKQPLGILTLEGGMVKSIYNSISRVYSPQAAAVKKHEYGTELSGLLENLHVSLGSTLGLPQSGISTVKDEMKYWQNKLSEKSSSRIDREKSQVFIGVLENIDKQLVSLDGGNSGTTIEEFLNTAHNNLDELWRLPYQYPQNRMADLLDTIGNRLLEICIEQLMAEDIWNISSCHINNLMSQSLDTIDAWLQLCDSLTRLFWPNYVQHAWLGEPHVPKRGQLFKERLTEIRNIKNLYKQIIILLDDENVEDLLYNGSPFLSFNIFDTTNIGLAKWNKALQQFELLLQPIDERIADAIKAQLHNHLSNPRQVIFIFSKYETLIQRPTVLELLTIEREQFVQSLHILLQDLRKAMSDTNMEPDTGHLSVICNECRWLKIVQHQIQEVDKVSHLVSGRDGYEQINKAVQEIKEETESLLRTNFEIWCGQHSTAVKSGELRLRDDESVVRFEKEGRQLMRVTFNPKLVTFIQDVREFANLGFAVPGELRNAATHASKFTGYARRLQQISTFHNTIGDRMIPCQRPIMLQNAMELSKLVQSQTVAWNDEASVQRYVDMLHTAVSKLSADNTLLVGYHEQAKRTVIKLMNTDLFTQGQIWKDEMRHLRDLIATLERQGFNNLDAFKLHWDHQLYKVLEYQYIIGLVDMNNKLPDINVDIMFRQRQLCFRPPEEEIREKYFTQLRRFIERPCGFRGLSDKGLELFRSMVEINRHHFGPLFTRAEELFNKLDRFKQIWLPWVALGCVDVEELCGIHLNTSEDWDRNFKACKHFSQKIAKIQSTEESIDCIVLNILPLRSDIEVISRRYWEALSNSLRNSILVDVSVIQDFLQTSLQFLQNVPMDETSITESGMKYEKMMTELPKIQETLSLVKAKDTCLAGWCKERVSSLTNIVMQWEKLQPLIENHAVILQHQVDMIKDQAESQIQNLSNEAEKFLLRWESTIAELESNDDATLNVFQERQEYWQNLQAKKTQLIEECQKFNMEFPADVLKPFEEIEIQMQTQSRQWKIYADFLNELQTILAEEWAIFRRRPYVLNELISKWESSVHASLDIPSKRVRQNVERLQMILPTLQQLQSDALNERHWARIFMLLKRPESKHFHNILVGDILADHSALQQASIEIGNLVKQASSEQIVKQALAELDQWAVTASFKLINHKDSNGSDVSLIKDYQEVLNKIGDNQSLLQSAKNSAAFEAFSDQAELWESRLNTLDALLVNLSQSQRRWVYLEPVFGAGTLKQEEALFKRIDKDFRYVMREIQADARVISLVKINNINSIVNSLETQLTRCQNNLMSYIMEKRNSFPRFYFLGDDDLLELLGQASKDADIIQKHIRKLFPGCHSLGIKANTNNTERTPLYTIVSVQSAEGDNLTLQQPVEMSGPIEIWLNRLVGSIQETLRTQIVECCNTSAVSFSESELRKYPIQVLSSTRAVHFTKQTEKSLLSMSLPKQQQQLNNEIAQYSALKNQTKDNLVQVKLRSLLLDLVHYVTVVEELIAHNVMHTNDWHWLSQLKFYLLDVGVGAGAGAGTMNNNNGKSVLLIRMVYAEFEYSYEFLGNPNKLVSTSLTHKCYLILTQSMHMGLGGNPFGPAGTGKTECVKALGAMLGRLVLVFNCDENVDTESMGLILTGLARCGAWGCFDEFNRLQEATLSAISMLIQPIQSALKDKADNVQIAEKNIKLNHHCGIFVTLNPAGAEYGGRQKLPGNIQALFRPIVMQQPEPREISRVLLFVEGFQQATEIAERIVELFDLCAKMLSAQRHYDWGLRELKTILLACGEGLRASQSATKAVQTNEIPSNVTYMEMSVVVHCLRISTMSKLALHDVTRFDMLLRNVFPEIESASQHESSSNRLQLALSAAFAPLNLCPNDMQIEKALQLHEQLMKRMGVVIVGPPGCGKSTLIALLRQALATTSANTFPSSSASSMSSQIRVHTISPKSMSRVQLLGRLDPDTRQWQDGVLTSTAVAVNAEAQHQRSWIVCDGSIDPEWIEALNSVLDDNKLLTLPSGWRIQFGSNVNFIFETDDVRHASPATISRMGIVNMHKEEFPQKPILQHLLSQEEFGDLLQSYINEHFQPAVEWLEKEYLSSLPIFDRFNILRALLLQAHGAQGREEFCVALFRALCGYLPTDRHNELAMLIYEKANIYLTNPNRAEFTYFNEPHNAIEYYETDVADVMNVAMSGSGPQLIATAAVKFYLSVLHKFLKAAALATPFLIVGPTGAAKTLLVQQAIQEHAGYELVCINCSTQLTPGYLVHILKQNCVTVSGIRGREFRARQVRLVVFLKNVDLCYSDAWGAMEVIEWLLQLVQRGGFYAENLEWINVSGVQICGSVSLPTMQATSNSSTTSSSSSNVNLLKLPPRFLAINQYLRVSYPTAGEMLAIVQQRLEMILHERKFQNNASPPNVQYVAECLMECIDKFQRNFNVAALEYAHYQFNPKLFMKLLDNLQFYPENAFNEALLCELVSTFRDRLATDDHVEKFESIMRQTMRKFYGKDKVFYIPKSTKHLAELQALQHDEWLEEVQKQITICASENFLIDAPVTKELLKYTAKIVRLLARHETHLMLLGRPGGRQLDAVYIAATLQQSKLQIIQGGSTYGILEFYNDLKLAMQTAALEDQCICLLIEHCWITHIPDIMKPIEAILEGSEILDLFGDDLESIASSLKPAAQLEGYQESIGSYFMKRAKRNLHLIITLDPTSLHANEYFNKFPALYRNMEFLYVRPASTETLKMLPKKFIEILNETQVTQANGHKTPVLVSSYFNDAVERLIPQQPPERFYKLIRSYFFIYKNFANDISKRLEKLQQGVDKLASAHAVVDSLKSNALKQEIALAEKRKLANDALEMISATMHSANDQKSNMLELKKQTQISSEKLKERKKEIEKELSEVEPILAEASAAVGQIKSESLSEIRSLRAPPETIRDILEGVLRLMGIRDTSWNSMKTFLAKRGVKEDIRLMDPARISPENCEAVERLLAAKGDSFEMKNAKRASAAAAPLAAWVKASVRYSKVVQSIQPLEREQNELQRNLDVAEGEIQHLMSGLDDVDNRVKQLSKKLNAYTQEAAVLELKLEEARNTLKAAEVLVEKLSAEFQTWSMQLEEYKQSHRTLDTKSLLIALVLNYFSHLSLERRSAAFNRLATELQLKDMFEIRKNLLTEQEQIIWESMGLARDAQIIENAALLRQMFALPYGSYPVPLVLDPTQTAMHWLEEYLRAKSQAFEIISQNNERIAYALELAVRFGKILIVQDCQDLRPPLLQMLYGRINVKFGNRQVAVGAKLIDLHEQFQLILFSKTTKLSNIAAESRAHLTCIPFTVTAVGLTDQLISKAIILKQPELEQKRIELLKKEGDLLRQRIDLEDKLLEELSSAQGDLLKNEKLLSTLNQVKESSSFIDKSLKESAVVMESLMAEYTQLRELCEKAANFYMSLTESYELSVVVFIKLFLRALEKREIVSSIDAKNESKYYEQLARSTFQYLARSTARDSQLTLALYCCKCAYPSYIAQSAWELFITDFMSSADASIGSVTLGKMQLPKFVSKEQALKLQILYGQVPEANEKLQFNSEPIWLEFLQGKTDELPFDMKLGFLRLLLVQIFRADLITFEARNVATNMLGISTDAIMQPSIEQLAEESSSERPILLITQSENDPATEIQSAAQRKQTKDACSEISIGKGMERQALEAVRQAASAGKWICIKNVHLVPHWLSELERELDTLKKSEHFRLWLICESTAGFNESIMYKFVKVLYEFPSGIKQKVRRMLQNFATQREVFKEPKLLKIRIVLFIVQAVLQERRKFIPQGWSKYYEFGESDLKAALEIVRWLDAVTASGRCDWQIMQRLCENVAYGGRISNTRDLQVLQRYLLEYCNNEVLSNRWAPLDKRNIIPTSTQLQDYQQAIAKFPDVDEPATFKLSKSTNITREVEHGRVIIRELRAAYYRQRGDEANNVEGNENATLSVKVEKQVKPLLSLWRKLASKCSILQTAKEMSATSNKTTPWSLFVISELKLASKCFQAVHNSLSQVHNWLKETQGQLKANISPDLIQNLTENQCPLDWRKIWPTGPAVAVDFIKALIMRAQAAEERYRSALHVEFTDAIDLTLVFNCESLLACLKLACAQKLQRSCKDLCIATSVEATNNNDTTIRLKIAALQIDGAIFKAGKLHIQSIAEGIDFANKTPDFFITYKLINTQIKTSAKRKSSPSNSREGNVLVPLYANSRRDKLICEVELPSMVSGDDVLLSGAALIVGN